MQEGVMMSYCGDYEDFLVYYYYCEDRAETQCKRASFLLEDVAHRAWKVYW
jgi:hypothetical protein